MSGRSNNKKIAIENSNSIKKSNELSMVKMNKGLTLNQMQLLAYAIYATQQGNTTKFIKSEFENKFNLVKYHTVRAKDDVNKLMDIKFGQVDLENDKFRFWNVFQEISYDEGSFEFKWTDRMLPHITELKDKYVLTDLTIASKFSNNSGWVLYDYLRAKYGCWYVTLSKQELMSFFGVENVMSYKNNTSIFKRKVLDVAIEEINSNTEIEVYYVEVKQNRSIVGFTLNWSTGGQVKKASIKQMDILKNIIDTIFKDTLMYMEIENKIDRDKALLIIRELQQIQLNYLEQDVGLTNEKCAELTVKANSGMQTLNYLLETKDKNIKVPLHNWLNS